MALQPKKTKPSKFDIKFCRICLTQNTTNNKDLSIPLSEKDEELEGVLIFEALEEVMGEKIMKLQGPYSAICSMCLGLLNISFDLKKQYFKSKEYILSLLDSSTAKTFYDSKKSLIYDGDKRTSSSRIKIPPKLKNGKVQTELNIFEKLEKEMGSNRPNVELVSDNTSYDIKDLVIVEDPPMVENNEIFQGFLNNLGSVISGSFSKEDEKSEIKPCPDPDVKIELVVKDDIANKDVTTIAPEYIENTESLVQEINSNFCPHCKKVFRSRSELQTHEPICEDFKLLRCYICKESRSNHKKLIFHIVNKHSIGKDLLLTFKQEKESVFCEVCNKLCGSKDSLRYHMLKHRVDLHCCCDQCGKKFVTPFYLKKHKRHAHERAMLDVCPICAKSFHYPGGLTTHMRIHRKDYKKEAKEVCPFCAKTFHYSGALTYHIKTHTKEYDVKCSYCDKKFGSNSSRKRHERGHTGERPYLCRYCGQSFKDISHRVSHEEALHTGKRRHKCQMCNAGFVQKEKLQLHMFTHGGSEICHICKRGFIDKDTLEYHLFRKHRIRRKENEDSNDLTREEMIDLKAEEDTFFQMDEDEDPIVDYNVDDE